MIFSYLEVTNYLTILIDFREWKCDKFPGWLQKTYRVKGTDFCKAQWEGGWWYAGWFFTSQPHCNNEVLPSISFYDRSENGNQDEPLCTINMNTLEAKEEFHELCQDVQTILNSDQGNR